MARKTFFNERNVEKALEFIRLGLNQKDALAQTPSRVAVGTWEEWKSKGKRLKWRPGKPILTEAIEEAEGQGAAFHVHNIHQAARGIVLNNEVKFLLDRALAESSLTDGERDQVRKAFFSIPPNWLASKWWLECRRREEYGRYTKVDHLGNVSQNVKVNGRLACSVEKEIKKQPRMARDLWLAMINGKRNGGKKDA